MNQAYNFPKVTNIEELTILKKAWLASLTSPQDGMWESFRNSATDFGIVKENEMIGYAAIDENHQLLQFYLLPKYLPKGAAIFKTFIDELKINTGIVGTNNPDYLSIALNFVKELKVPTYLFRNTFEVTIEEKEDLLKACQAKDIEKIVHFCHYSTGAPKDWLVGYIGGLVEKKEIFSLENNEEIIGTCEVRKSTTAPAFADIGMIVSPDYRQKGYGTYLLNTAKNIALKWGKIPICSCEKDNVGSLKAITNCGFVSRYQLLSITFR